MARILIIDDERDLQEVLSYNLRQAGHEPLAALCGRDGLELARAEHPDLVLLDLMLPDLSGFEVCRLLKSDPATRGLAVVILTARGEEIDRVVGFELGVDDYVVKPFSVRELVLRVSAVLRRSHPASSPLPLAVFGLLRIDRESHRAWVGEQELELTALEFRLLLALHDGRNRVHTRSVLLDDDAAKVRDIVSKAEGDIDLPAPSP
jgi:two-component system, OmpR family, phosphate regulon response regulator PhoB